jgi:hypothetical protein
MGGMMAPVEGSGSIPAWMYLVAGFIVYLKLKHKGA